jgi:hypothetical protein
VQPSVTVKAEFGDWGVTAEISIVVVLGLVMVTVPVWFSGPT